MGLYFSVTRFIYLMKSLVLCLTQQLAHPHSRQVRSVERRVGGQSVVGIMRLVISCSGRAHLEQQQQVSQDEASQLQGRTRKN